MSSRRPCCSATRRGRSSSCNRTRRARLTYSGDTEHACAHTSQLALERAHAHPLEEPNINQSRVTCRPSIDQLAVRGAFQRHLAGGKACLHARSRTSVSHRLPPVRMGYNTIRTLPLYGSSVGVFDVWASRVVMVLSCILYPAWLLVLDPPDLVVIAYTYARV